MKRLHRLNFKEEYPRYVLEPNEYELSSWAETYIYQLRETAKIIYAHISRNKCIPRIQDVLEVKEAYAERLYKETQRYHAIRESAQGTAAFWADILINEQVEVLRMAREAGDLKTQQKALENMAKIVKDNFGGIDAEKYKHLQLPNFNFTAVPQGVAELGEGWEDDVAKLIGDAEVVKRLSGEYNIEDAVIIEENEDYDAD